MNAAELTACLTSATSGLKELSGVSAKAADIIKYMDKYYLIKDCYKKRSKVSFIKSISTRFLQVKKDGDDE